MAVSLWFFESWMMPRWQNHKSRASVSKNFRAPVICSMKLLAIQITRDHTIWNRNKACALLTSSAFGSLGIHSSTSDFQPLKFNVDDAHVPILFPSTYWISRVMNPQTVCVFWILAFIPKLGWFWVKSLYCWWDTRIDATPRFLALAACMCVFTVSKGYIPMCSITPAWSCLAGHIGWKTQ